MIYSSRKKPIYKLIQFKITKITFIILHHFSIIFNKQTNIFNFISIFIIIFKIPENFSKIPRIFLKLSLYNSPKTSILIFNTIICQNVQIHIKMMKENSHKSLNFTKIPIYHNSNFQKLQNPPSLFFTILQHFSTLNYSFLFLYQFSSLFSKF